MLDVDDTLSSAGGPVGEKEIALFQTLGAVWGILSSRCHERSLEACQQIGVSPSFVETCRVNQRAEELREIKLDHPIRGNFIYIADRGRDKEEAQRAGWSFIFASEFAKWLEHYTLAATR